MNVGGGKPRPYGDANSQNRRSYSVPAPVPAGFTRGPIVLIGYPQTAPAEAALLQRFWNEAGGYGARILIVPTGSDAATVAHFAQMLHSWEVDALEVLPVYTRTDAQQTSHLAAIDHATAILILDGDPLKLARTLGGTPVAQAIRRANARSKVACAIGYGANFLCQHMLIVGEGVSVQFAPGLGAINRVALDLQRKESMSEPISGQRLLAATAYNPFLVGVGLSVDAGVVVYPDTTLEVFGSQPVLLVDSAGAMHTEPPDQPVALDLQTPGIQLHRLPAGATFNFDRRTVQPPPPTDIPLTAVPTIQKA